MTEHNEERLGALLRRLPPAPQGWVKAAQELPRARRTLDELVARAEADAAVRKQVLADLEAALAQAGLEPERPLVDELRRRLSDK